MTDLLKGGIMYKENIYVHCPHCGKKLFRIDKDSEFKKIYLWCKNCKKEIECKK